MFVAAKQRLFIAQVLMTTTMTMTDDGSRSMPHHLQKKHSRERNKTETKLLIMSIQKLCVEKVRRTI
jgi:hypothetical protein